MTKKITFSRALLKVVLFELIVQVFIWFIIIKQLLDDYYSNYSHSSSVQKFDFEFLMNQSHYGIFTSSNSAVNLTLFFIITTVLFIFFIYYKKTDVKLLKKYIYSIILFILGFIFFISFFFIIYSKVIGNPLGNIMSL